MFNNNEKEKIVNIVHELRKEKKVTQESLAESVGVTRQTIISIEKGHYTPSLMLAFKISKFFNLPLEQIFFYEKRS